MKSLVQFFNVTLIISIFLGNQSFANTAITGAMDNIFLLTPSPGCTKAVTDELFMIHFKNGVTANTSSSITIFNEDGSVFEEVKLNSPSIIAVQSQRIIFDPVKDMVPGNKYYVNFPFNDIYSVAQILNFQPFEANMAAEISDLPVNYYLAIGGDDSQNRIDAYNSLKDSLLSRNYPSFRFEYRLYEGLPHGEVSATAAFHDAFRIPSFTRDWPVDTPTTRISEITGNTGINIYPNPATGYLTINLDNQASANAYLYIINTTGSIILEQKIYKNTTLLDAARMSPGMYMLIIENGGDRFTEKIIIK